MIDVRNRHELVKSGPNGGRIPGTKNVPCKSEQKKIIKGSLDSIPSPSAKIVIVNKLLKTRSLLTTPGNFLPFHLKQTFLQCEGEGDGIESRLPFKIISTLISILTFNPKLYLDV